MSTRPEVETAQVAAPSRMIPRLRKIAIEVGIIAVLYVGYSASRLLASDAFAPARGRALDLLTFEKVWRIDVESWLNGLFVQHSWLGLFGSYWYATAHYLVTGAVLIWIFRRSFAQYLIARRTIVIATLVGLACYLTMPTAPPRLVGGYADVLSLHAAAGWWGADASAPKGMGSLTNELAALPSMHAGWSMWVALVLIRAGVPKAVQVAGLVYASMTTVVIIGTGNHWLIDAVLGWAIVLVVFGLVSAWDRRPGTPEDEAEPVTAPAPAPPR